MAHPQWAQLQGEYPCPLRRGAWYRVVNTSTLEVVVDVHKKPIRVPRRHLRLADQPAQVWAVVERTSPSPRGSQPVGSRHAVCPSCRERVPLEGRPVDLRCPKCNELFVVAWKEAERAAPSIQVMPSSQERRPRLSMPTVPRKRGPDRRSGERREEVTRVDEERRAGSDRRRNTERRKGRPPRDAKPS
jgi:hypothetical protein